MKPSIKEHADQLEREQRFPRYVCERMAYDRYISEQEIVSEEWRNKYVEETKRCNALTNEMKNLVKRSVLEKLVWFLGVHHNPLSCDYLEALKEAHEELH